MMMNRTPNKPHAEELEQKLSALLDGELAPPDAARLQERLAADGALRQSFEELETLDDLLGQWPAPPMADVRCIVMARVADDLARAKPRRQPWRWAGVAWAATWLMGGMLTGMSLWVGVNEHLREQAAAESMSQDMTLSMIMTEDWTPPITIDEDAQP